jgi:hypothetical protein
MMKNRLLPVYFANAPPYLKVSTNEKEAGWQWYHSIGLLLAVLVEIFKKIGAGPTL